MQISDNIGLSYNFKKIWQKIDQLKEPPEKETNFDIKITLTIWPSRVAVLENILHNESDHKSRLV